MIEKISLLIIFSLLSPYSIAEQGLKECFLKQYETLKPLRITVQNRISLLSYESPSQNLKDSFLRYSEITEELLAKDYEYWLAQAKDEDLVSMSQPFWVRDIPNPYVNEEKSSIIASIDKEYAMLIEKQQNLYNQLLELIKSESKLTPKPVLIQSLRYELREFKSKSKPLAKKCHDLVKS